MNVGHTSATTKAYNAAQQTGYILPNAPPPPPAAHNNGCGGFGAIIVAIIAIAVQFIPGINLAVDTALEPLFSAIGLPLLTTAGVATTAGSIVGAAGAAIVGDTIGQGVAIAVGAQDDFNFAEVALAGIGAGIGAGLGDLGAIQGLDRAADNAFNTVFETTGSKIASTAVNGAIGSALTQGIGVVTGLQKQFSWASVAAAGVEAGVEAALGPAIGGQLSASPDKNGHFPLTPAGALAGALTGTAALIAGGAARSLLSGEDFSQSLQDELPNTIGVTIGNMVGEEIRAETNSPASLASQKPPAGNTPDNFVAAFEAGMAEGEAAGPLQASGVFAGPGALPPGNQVGVLGLLSRGEALLKQYVLQPIEQLGEQLAPDLVASAQANAQADPQAIAAAAIEAVTNGADVVVTATQRAAEAAVSGGYYYYRYYSGLAQADARQAVARVGTFEREVSQQNLAVRELEQQNDIEVTREGVRLTTFGASSALALGQNISGAVLGRSPITTAQQYVYQERLQDAMRVNHGETFHGIEIPSIPGTNYAGNGENDFSNRMAATAAALNYPNISGLILREAASGHYDLQGLQDMDLMKKIYDDQVGYDTTLYVSSRDVLHNEPTDLLDGFALTHDRQELAAQGSRTAAVASDYQLARGAALASVVDTGNPVLQARDNLVAQFALAAAAVQGNQPPDGAK